MMRFIITRMIQPILNYQKFLFFTILLSSIILSQEPEETLALDLDIMWDEVIWEEITEIGREEIQEVDNITAVAGVRGAEAEDEALALLYYRKSMYGISQTEYKKVYGKLKNKRDELFKKDKNNPKLEEMDNYLSYIRKKIKV